MKNRTTAVIITILVVFLFGCPGILFLCNGLLALIEVITDYQFQIIGYGYNAPYWVIGSFCAGVLAIIIMVLVAYFVLRKKKEPLPPSSDEPLPPPI